MLSSNQKYLNIIVTVVILSSVDAEFTVAPSDTEAAVGDNITLYCSSSLGRCEWYHRPVGYHGHEILFQQGYIYNGYKGRFTVTETNNACNLQIERVSKGDAGLFTCMETSTQAAQKTAELVVFEQFPSNKTCAAKITCAPTCNNLELSCAMQCYGNLHPIMECNDGNGKQLTSTLSEDKTTATVHIKGFALQPLTFVCEVKYPSKSLSSKYVWSVSIPAYLEDITPVIASTTEQPEQKTVPVSVFIAAVVVAIVALVGSTLVIVLFCIYIRRNKRKLRKLGDNPETGDKKMSEDQDNRPQTEENCHAEKSLLLNNAAEVPTFTTTSSNAICGLAILGNEVFMVTKDTSIVDVFDLQSTKYKRQWKVDGLIDPNDMAACPQTELIFICDWKNCKDEEEIFSLDKTGMLRYRWRCEGERGRISVTKECSIIIADGNANVIYEYKYDGQLMNTIGPQLKGPPLTLCYAIKQLESGNFVTSFEDKITKSHEIIIFDSAGNILESFKNDPAYISARSFSTLESLAVDSKGNIYLSCVGQDSSKAPSDNRIVSFTPQLEWKMKNPDPFQNAEHDLSDPFRFRAWESEGLGLLLVQGKIRIFDLTV